jgi:Homing endonuclease associated repeat
MVDDRASRMLSALVEAKGELGRWPIAEEWDQSGRKPSRRTFVRYFGSWDGACRAAGAWRSGQTFRRQGEQSSADSWML